LIPRNRKKDGLPFYGCEKYFDTSCGGGMDFSDGVRKLNEQIRLEDEFGEIEDVEF
jgi:hypothetical protein